jgi:hypothetical protein
MSCRAETPDRARTAGITLVTGGRALARSLTEALALAARTLGARLGARADAVGIPPVVASPARASTRPSPGETAEVWRGWFEANRPASGPDPRRILPGQRLTPPR